MKYSGLEISEGQTIEELMQNCIHLDSEIPSWADYKIKVMNMSYNESQ